MSRSSLGWSDGRRNLDPKRNSKSTSFLCQSEAYTGYNWAIFGCCLLINFSPGSWLLRGCEFILSVRVRGYKVWVWGQMSGVRRCQARAQCGVWTPHYANSGHVGQLIQPQGHPQTSPLSHPTTTSIHWLLLVQSVKIYLLFASLVHSKVRSFPDQTTFMNTFYINSCGCDTSKHLSNDPVCLGVRTEFGKLLWCEEWGWDTTDTKHGASQ